MEYDEAFVKRMWECVTIIEAQEQLKTLTAMDWPNMKKNARQKLHKELSRQAYPSAIRKKNTVTLEDLKRLQGG